MNRLNKKGISPVIATVIIVSVAIAIAVAVAFWMTGITGLFTRYERVEITNCYADWDSTNELWKVIIQLRNSGSDDATIDEIFINGRPHNSITNLADQHFWYYSEKVTPTVTVSGTALSVKYGDNSFTKFDFDNGVPLKAGEDMTIVIIMFGPGFEAGDIASINGEDVSDYGAVSFKHGASIEIKLHTAAGKEYPKTVVLP